MRLHWVRRIGQIITRSAKKTEGDMKMQHYNRTGYGELRPTRTDFEIWQQAKSLIKQAVRAKKIQPSYDDINFDRKRRASGDAQSIMRSTTSTPTPYGSSCASARQRAPSTASVPSQKTIISSNVMAEVSMSPPHPSPNRPRPPNQHSVSWAVPST